MELDDVSNDFIDDDWQDEEASGFEPCLSCPWSGACRERGSCEADA